MIAPRIWRIIVMKLFLLLASEIFGLPSYICMYVQVPSISFRIELKLLVSETLLTYVCTFDYHESPENN